MPTVKHHDGDGIGGRVRGRAQSMNPYAERHKKQITCSTEPLNQRFSIPVSVHPRSAYFACLFVNTLDSDNQLVRSVLRAWTVFRLTWSVVDKCNLEQISCLLKLLHGPYTVSIAPYSLIRGNLLEFTSLQDIHSRKCAAQCLHTHWQNLLEKREVWHNIPL